MNRQWIGLLMALFLAAGLASPASADWGDFAVGGKVSTLGLGVEATAGITPYLNGRVGLNGFTYNYDGTESDVEYDVDLDLFTFGALLDYHPFTDMGFRATVGLMINGNKLDMEGELDPQVLYEIGDGSYTGAEIGKVDGELDFNDIAPYLGIGWGNALDKDGNWSFSFDLGVLFQGSGDLSYNAPGTGISDPARKAQFDLEVEKERRELEDDLDDFEFYPVIALGVMYRF